MTEVIGNNIDRLVTVEMRPQGIVRGNVVQLYEAARTMATGPLTMLAAEKLISAIKPGDPVLLVTGAGSWPWLPMGETDGPPGAASLARSLTLGLGARPVILSEDRHLPAIAAACRAAGLIVTDARTVRERPGAVALEEIPVEDDAALAAAERTIEQWQPSAVIAIEKLGPNRKGAFHTLQGMGCTDQTGKAHHLFATAQAAGILTVAYADGGNEIGCGVIYEETRRIMPTGSQCLCPCADGMASAVSADVLVVAATSNWGAYGTSACLAFLMRDSTLLHDEVTAMRVVEQCAMAGAGDGMSGMSVPWVDGSGPAVQPAMITILHMIVENGIRTISRPF